MKLEGARLVVIGGAGLIGSHTVDALLQEDVAEIVVYDNFVRGTLENLAGALADPRVRVFEAGGDIGQTDILASALATADGVFHFAALWLLQCYDFPRAAFDVNIHGTFNVLEACVAAGVKRLVYSSSASVYGDAVTEPMMEDHPFNNTNFYGATKIAGEAMARALHYRYGLPYVGLRYMNVYGPRQDYQGAYIAVIMKMLDAIDRGEPLKVYGDGSQAYDFVYVGDCAAANVCAMRADVVDECYNVGTGIRTSIGELAELLVRLTGTDVAIEFLPEGLTFVKNRIGSPIKAGRELGFKAQVDLEEGLQELMRWRNDHKSEVASRRARSGVMRPTRTIAIAKPFMGEEEWEALRAPIESGWLTHGPQVSEFERRFAARHQVAHGVAVTSCTTGLHLALATLGIRPGDEVIVPAFTWVATANVVVYCGGTPVFVDVDPLTYNVDPAAVAAAVTSRTRAVIVVHLFGLCADVDAVRASVPSDVAIVEDAACAAGAGYHGRPPGGLGALGVFSFHPRKVITTGEGGMLTTDDASLAARAEQLRNHGASVSEEQRHLADRPYVLPAFDELGFNYRMTDLQGAVGLVQLGRLDDLIAERRQRACELSTALADLAWLRLPFVPSGYEHSWQSYVAVVEDSRPHYRELVMEHLMQRGVNTRPGTHSVVALGYYRKEYGTEPRNYPVTTELGANSIALPLHNRMTDADYEYLVDVLREI